MEKETENERKMAYSNQEDFTVGVMPILEANLTIPVKIKINLMNIMLCTITCRMRRMTNNMRMAINLQIGFES